MPGLDTIGLFAVASLALVLIPGPAVLYIVARGIGQGRSAAVVSALGIEAGALVHVLAATVGLSALLASSAVAFSVVKYAGAAYLVYLGIRTLVTRPEPHRSAMPEAVPLRRVFAEGAVVNALNPKVALFFLAFLPQFVDPSRGDATAQVLVLGGIFLAIATVCDLAYALLSGSLGHWLRRSAGFARTQRYVSGGTYLALGVVTALSSPNRTK